MKKLFLIPLIIIVVCGLIFGGRARAAPAPPIKIGVMYPLTGVLAMTGQLLVTGAMFGFEEAGYEVAGRKIEVIVEDSGTVPDMAVDKARKLVEFDKVCMVLGPLVGATKMGVGAYMSKVGVPHLGTQPCPLGMTKYEWSFLVGGSEPQMSYTMGLYAYDKMGLRTVTVMTEDVVQGHGFLDAFMDAFKKRGGQVIQEQYTPFPCTDFAPYLAALRDADAVAAWFEGADAIRFLNQFHEFGIRKRMPLVGSFFGGFFALSILRHLTPEAIDAVIGEHCPWPYTDRIETDINKRFVEAFNKKHGYNPDEGQAQAYSAALVALEALKVTGGDTTPDKLRQAILKLDFEAPEGPIRFDPETRCLVKNVYIGKIDKIGDKYMVVPVYTYKAIPPRGY